MTLKAGVVLNYLKCTDLKEDPNKQYIPPNFVDRDDVEGNVMPGEWRNKVQDAGFGAVVLFFQIINQKST